MRFSLMSYQMPEVSGPKNGCFAKVPRHPPMITKGLFKSTYQDDFLSKFEKEKSKFSSPEIFTSTGVNSGMQSNFEPINKKHITSLLINEDIIKVLKQNIILKFKEVGLIIEILQLEL